MVHNTDSRLRINMMVSARGRSNECYANHWERFEMSTVTSFWRLSALVIDNEASLSPDEDSAKEHNKGQ